MKTHIFLLVSLYLLTYASGMMYKKVTKMTAKTPPCKTVVSGMSHELASTFDPDESVKSMKKFWYPDMVWDGPVGYGNCTTIPGWLKCEHYPFRSAFPTPSFSAFGHVGRGDYAAITFWVNTDWTGSCAKIPANNATAIFRGFDAYHCIQKGKDYKIQYNWVIFDMLLMMYQAKPKIWVLPVKEEDLPLPQFVIMHPPMSYDGLGLDAPFSWLQDPKVTEHSQSVISRFLSAWQGHRTSAESLFDFMEFGVKFYGPVGIGYADNINDLAKHFFKPLEIAFPNYRVEPNFEPIAEGRFGAVHGYIVGHHLGPYLGQPASGKLVRYRFAFNWYLENEKITQFWAVVDLPHLFLQFGVDLFKKIPH